FARSLIPGGCAAWAEVTRPGRRWSSELGHIVIGLQSSQQSSTRTSLLGPAASADLLPFNDTSRPSREEGSSQRGGNDLGSLVVAPLPIGDRGQHAGRRS